MIPVFFMVIFRRNKFIKTQGRFIGAATINHSKRGVQNGFDKLTTSKEQGIAIVEVYKSKHPAFLINSFVETID